MERGHAGADAWSEWNEATPELTRVELDPAVFLECADPAVRELGRLWFEIDAALEELGDEDATRGHSQGGKR